MNEVIKGYYNNIVVEGNVPINNRFAFEKEKPRETDEEKPDLEENRREVQDEKAEDNAVKIDYEELEALKERYRQEGESYAKTLQARADAEYAEATEKASKLLANIKEQERIMTEDMQRKAALAVEEGRKQGVEAGYAEGLKKGEEDGYVQGLKKCKETLLDLKKLCEDVEREKGEALAENRRGIFDLALSVAEKITMTTFAQKDKRALEKMITAAAKEFRNAKSIRVTLSKLDLSEDMEADFRLLEKCFAPTVNVEFEAIDSAESGTILLESDSEILDTSVSTQLKMINELGRGKFREKEEEPFDIEEEPEPPKLKEKPKSRARGKAKTDIAAANTDTVTVDESAESTADEANAVSVTDAESSANTVSAKNTDTAANTDSASNAASITNTVSEANTAAAETAVATEAVPMADSALEAITESVSAAESAANTVSASAAESAANTVTDTDITADTMPETDAVSAAESLNATEAALAAESVPTAEPTPTAEVDLITNTSELTNALSAEFTADSAEDNISAAAIEADTLPTDGAPIETDTLPTGDASIETDTLTTGDDTSIIADTSNTAAAENSSLSDSLAVPDSEPVPEPKAKAKTKAKAEDAITLTKSAPVQQTLDGLITDGEE